MLPLFPKGGEYEQKLWMEYIKNYHFSIWYFPSKGNVVADAFSRRSITLACLCREWAMIEEFRELHAKIQFLSDSVMSGGM